MEQIKDDEINEFISIVYDEKIIDDVKGTIFEIVRPDLNYELFLKRHEILGFQTKDDDLKYKMFFFELILINVSSLFVFELDILEFR